MIIKNKEKLGKYTSFKIGGEVEHLYFPEKKGELIDLILKLKKEKRDFRFLGNGTNVLINDKEIKGVVINNRRACKYIDIKEGGLVKVGASYDLRIFIRQVIDSGLDGPAELIGIPGSIGGAIYMNAGLGASSNVNISDQLLYVDVFDGQNMKRISHEACNFSYRNSIFKKKKDWIILSAVFRYKKQAKEIGRTRLEARMEKIKDRSYLRNYTAGSVFRESNYQIMKILRGLKIGKAEYSQTMNNVIHNIDGQARYKDVIMLINIAKFFHFILLKKIKLEIEVWDK